VATVTVLHLKNGATWQTKTTFATVLEQLKGNTWVELDVRDADKSTATYSRVALNPDEVSYMDTAEL